MQCIDLNEYPRGNDDSEILPTTLGCETRSSVLQNSGQTENSNAAMSSCLPLFEDTRIDNRHLAIDNVLNDDVSHTR
jgi:hypothetical protein